MLIICNYLTLVYYIYLYWCVLYNIIIIIIITIKAIKNIVHTISLLRRKRGGKQEIGKEKGGLKDWREEGRWERGGKVGKRDEEKREKSMQLCNLSAHDTLPLVNMCGICN